ncbi:uncharacterized protein LOC132721365 [Ruditapes philippinarum]|uniref:uncharacterized protein LOC132721365 n=1 Tax=Ruditapes philippinarum TaxID=129788 RepID=UPI00295B285F|nr:uncharacterized protein LOC132721365 [Ruditapes philippinarum]XP_060561635.1 uncharacterized protein LOC132721365 [Ruditapes philippinarum]XP_060561636.1 uncharacterized protein LOC132721365 [Ruditapes philippinarum]
MSDSKEKLRLVTYLSPGIPVEIFETLMNYLEEVTGRDAYLRYESRWPGPPADRTDPFTDNEVDIGFMESSDYLRLIEHGNKFIEVCGAGAVHVHPKNSGRAVYYSDIIINARNKLKYKELHDLRGHTFGYSSGKSISASICMLEQLKKLGFNASFFGNLYESGSHLASIKNVLDSQVDVAAVDSNVLAGFLRAHPYYKDDLCVITSLGPLPTYPIVLNTRLSGEVRSQITKALLDMNKSTKWTSQLQRQGISGFVSIDSSLYDLEKDLVSAIGKLSMSSTYY